MPVKLPVSAVIAAIMCFSAAGWARGSREKKADKQAIPDAVNRQFQWEEKVVGPKEKGVDHRKIAAMQEQGRREEEARLKVAQPHDTARGPAMAQIATPDIEKPAAPAVARKPAKKAAVAEPPKKRDAIDNVLAEQGTKPRAGASSGLGSLLAVDEKPAAAPPRPVKKSHRARHRRN